ncbi:ATP-dependent endonuclease [Methanohalophilus sp. RSK]|uniref:ATP-dependent nuclease n=1 Tax=Methanohalophilus sp. RSK TaxID=2485783 RepID=UPI0013148A85|nr:AAA family ATPase [Methanohalophilus sp. RSK]
MQLTSICLKNFQCFKDSGQIPIYNMSIFVGENDSGKTSILQALDYFLNNNTIPSTFFHVIGDDIHKICEIQLTFIPLNETDIPEEYIVNNEVVLKKEFVLNDTDNVESRIYVKKILFERDELNQIESLKAPALKDLYEEFNLSGYTKVPDAQEVIRNYTNENIDNFEIRSDWAEVKWKDIAEFLPLFEYYGSSDYSNPQNIIKNTLNSVYRTFFYDSDEVGNLVLKEELALKKDEIEKELDQKIEDELKDKINSVIGKVENIGGDYTIDFAAGFNLSNINVDYGNGFHPIDNIGEGSRKRLCLAIMEWDREIRSQKSYRRVIRGYDEPDSSLDYRAQKEMFYVLKNMSEDASNAVQPIICTHSISMIDRAPANIIGHIINENGVSRVEHLEEDEDSIVKDFLDGISEISGITNSSIFFERCFLIIEGMTEYNALPLLYRKYYERSMPEDGVVLINLEGNSSWDKTLKLFNQNKSKATIMFLDNDTNTDSSVKNITKQSLKQIGIGEEFLNNIVYVGEKEFEDVFSNEIICRCLNEYWPKIDNEKWTEEQIERLRDDDKFSESLKDMIGRYKTESGAAIDYLKKPEFGKYIADTVSKDEISEIDDLKKLFNKINEIVN